MTYPISKIEGLPSFAASKLKSLGIRTTEGLLELLGHLALFSLSHFLGDLLTVVVAGSVASMIYIGAILLLRVEEVRLVKNAVMAKLGKR